MLERINLVMKSRNLNAAQFADEIGVQRSSVSHILTGRNKASLDFLLKVLQRYPDIDTDWLLTGKVIMMRTSSVKALSVVEPTKVERNITSLGSVNKEDKSDLFTQLEENKEESNESANNRGEVGSFKQEKVNTISENEGQKKPGEMVGKPNSTRNIEKIVIFYSDKTFSEYKPEC